MFEKTTIMLLVLGPVFAVSLAGQQENDVASEIIAMERAALDRWGNGDTLGAMEEVNVAPEMTYFAPDLEWRSDGREALRDLYASLEGRIHIDRYEMINPKVQVHDDTAVLTYNLINYNSSDESGEWTVTSRWNSTKVYSRIDGEWKLIHSHWSYIRPLAQEEEGEEEEEPSETP